MRDPEVQIPIRVLLAKAGLDGHDRGVKIVARALRDSGMEVIYTGLHRTPEEIVTAAIQEDADVIGISLLSGAHMTLFPQVISLLKEWNVSEHFVLVGGGVIPDEDIAELKAMGVQEILGQDTRPEYVAQQIFELVSERQVRNLWSAGLGRQRPTAPIFRAMTRRIGSQAGRRWTPSCGTRPF
jgi:methylmalonyl-CoA mutase cobalamin-binding domain/chain